MLEHYRMTFLCFYQRSKYLQSLLSPAALFLFGIISSTANMTNTATEMTKRRRRREKTWKELALTLIGMIQVCPIYVAATARKYGQRKGENNQISISEHGDIHSRKSKCAASTHSKKWLASWQLWRGSTGAPVGTFHECVRRGKVLPPEKMRQKKKR